MNAYTADTFRQTSLYPRLVEFRDLHQHPELSWCERRTARQICEFLKDRGISFQSRVAGTGIVAEIPGVKNGRCVALRADMDALPVVEETGLAFSSQIEGVMHACGHDGHTSMLLGAACSLQEDGGELPATVRLIFQPAEETGEGAKAMIEAGVLDDVAMIFGGHVDRHYPVGSMAVTDGAVNASSDRFSITINGRGGHAARPHETVDAVVAGSLMVISLQTIVSREVNPAHPSVVTVGTFNAGTASNVIAGRAHLEGSIRSQDHDVRQSLHHAIRRMATSIGQLHGADVDVTIHLGTPVVINPPQYTEVARRAAALTVGPSKVLKMEIANMGGEDFGYYLEHVGGCYVRFGTAREGVEQHPAHSSKFDFDEEALATGAVYYHNVAKLAGEQIARGELAERVAERDARSTNM